MFLTRKTLPRRTFLRAMGTAVALPMLDAMVPALAARPPQPTPRFGFIYIANGVIQNQWTPARTGAGFDLPPILQPFASVQSHINVLSGLSHREADTKGDGNGDHPRASAVWLTGIHAYDRAQPGVEVRLATTVDQMIAQKIGGPSRHAVARARRRLSDAGCLRLRRLLLRQHGLVAERDDAESDRVASARWCSSGSSATAAAPRQRLARAADRSEHPRLGARRSEPCRRHARRRRQGASSASISTRCARSSSGFSMPSRSRSQLELPERPTRHSRPRSRCTPS